MVFTVNQGLLIFWLLTVILTASRNIRILVIKITIVLKKLKINFDHCKTKGPWSRKGNGFIIRIVD